MLRLFRGSLLLALATSLTVAAAPIQTRALAAADPASLEGTIHTLINAQRRANGRAELRIDTRLVAAARAHSQDMAARHDLDHTGGDGSQPNQRMARAGYAPISWWGENIAAWDENMEALVAAWMNSATHRANILSPSFVDTGIGVVIDGEGFVWVTQDFGRSQGSPPPVGPPAAPGSLRAKQVRKTKLTLVWQDRSTNETGFRLERKGPADADFVVIGGAALNRANVRSYLDTGLTRKTNYAYRLSAFNGEGSSAFVQITARTK